MITTTIVTLLSAHNESRVERQPRLPAEAHYSFRRAWAQPIAVTYSDVIKTTPNDWADRARRLHSSCQL